MPRPPGWPNLAARETACRAGGRRLGSALVRRLMRRRTCERAAAEALRQRLADVQTTPESEEEKPERRAQLAAPPRACARDLKGRGRLLTAMTLALEEQRHWQAEETLTLAGRPAQTERRAQRPAAANAMQPCCGAAGRALSEEEERSGRRDGGRMPLLNDRSATPAARDRAVAIAGG